MQVPMAPSARCQSCHASLTGDAPEGLCPACLLQFAWSGKVMEAESPSPRAEGWSQPAGLRRFGDFELEGEIARGGMGVVYRARQLSLNRRVALKLILVGRWASAAQVRRFQTEAEAAARLVHPHIVSVYEVGQLAGQRFLCMPLIEGGNLASRLEVVRADPTFREGVTIVLKVARAVQYAHDHGILHRDLKPTNILIDSTGEPHLTDFGLAKILEEDQKESGTGTMAILGTPAYMAPEQAGGGSRDASTRGDVYSLGAVLYEILTGQPPFAAPTALATLEMVRRCDPLPPRRLNPAVDRDLETVCLTCLRKEPLARYSSPLHLAADLERWLQKRPILARRASPPERLWRWASRQPAAATSVALLLVIAVGLLVTVDHLRRQRDATRGHLWRSLLAQAASLRATSEAGRRDRALEVVRQAARLHPSLPVRNEAIAALALPDLRIRHRWPGFPDGTKAIALEKRQRYFARADGNGRIEVRDVQTDRLLTAWDGPSPACDWIRFSPDGGSVAARYGFTNRTSQLHVWPWPDATPVLVLPLPSGSAVPVDFAPDNPSLFVGAQDGTVQQVQTATGDVIGRHSVGGIPAQVAVSPDGQWLAIGFNNEQRSAEPLNAAVRVLELRTGKVTTYTYPSHVRSFAWHPAHPMMAVGCNDYRIYEEDVTHRRRVKVYERQENPVLSCAYSHNGLLLASLGYDGSVILWDALTARRMVSTRVRCGQLEFAPGSPRLGLGVLGPDVMVWETAPQHGFFEVPQTQLYCSSASFTADGRWLALVNPFGGVLVADLDLRRTAAWYPVIGIRSAWFAPDGQHLMTSGHSGLQRWPFQAGPDKDGVSLGEPERLPLPTTNALEYAAASPRGSVAFAEGFEDVWLGTLGNPASWKSLGVRGTRSLGFSPDGRWLVTVPGQAEALCVWDVSTARPILRHSIQTSSALFSPDGRWLAIAADRAIHLWTVGSWERHLVIPTEGLEGIEQPMAFSPEGRLLALVRRLHAVQLVEAQTGREVATLQAPEPSTIQALRFSPDRRRLAVVTRTRGLRVWDLSALQVELGRLGL